MFSTNDIKKYRSINTTKSMNINLKKMYDEMTNSWEDECT